MKIVVSSESLSEVKADVVVVGVSASGLAPDAEKSVQQAATPTKKGAKATPAAAAPSDGGGRFLDKHLKALDVALGGGLSKLAREENFRASLGETIKVPLMSKGAGIPAASRLVLIGLGSGDVTERESRVLAGKAALAAAGHETLAVFVPGAGKNLRAAAEGARLGAYKFTQYLTGDRKPKRELKTVKLISQRTDPRAEENVARGEAVATAINLVRDLVNMPPNDLTPTALAEVARKESKAAGIECTVLDKKAIEKKGMKLLLAVSSGSGQEPRFVHMKYVPKQQPGKRKPKRVVFVGKGLTFDSGGLCIKAAKGMGDMKCDMAGAAVTIGTLIAAAKLGLNVEVHGVIAATENMPGENAYRPGDIFPALDGKTVEIINTDAEGRLVLADALVYAQGLEPDYMVDHATLTGACIVALGPYAAGFFANDEDLAERYQAAAKEAGETVWRLPLYDELRDMLKSDVADMKHTGESTGGSITAALFLREFVGKTKWAHMDIAGPAFVDRPRSINPKGGTGFGVMTALKFLESL